MLNRDEPSRALRVFVSNRRPKHWPCCPDTSGTKANDHIPQSQPSRGRIWIERSTSHACSHNAQLRSQFAVGKQIARLINCRMTAHGAKHANRISWLVSLDSLTSRTEGGGTIEHVTKRSLCRRAPSCPYLGSAPDDCAQGSRCLRCR